MLLEKVFGKNVISTQPGNVSCQIVESAAVLDLQQQQAKKQGRDPDTKKGQGQDISMMSFTSTPSKSSSSLLPNGDMPFKVKELAIFDLCNMEPGDMVEI